MYDELRLPDTELARAAYDFVKAGHPEYLFNHCVRTFLYAREIGRGVDFDAEVLFLACVLHDVGLTVPGGQRFEVDGADEARRFVLERGGGAAQAEVVWQAIALHTSAGIANRMRAEIALVHAGAGVDVAGMHGLDGLREEVEARLPWLDLASAITGAIVERARTDPRTAPPLTFPAQVVRDWTGVHGVGWREVIGMDKRHRLV